MEAPQDASSLQAGGGEGTECVSSCVRRPSPARRRSARHVHLYGPTTPPFTTHTIVFFVFRGICREFQVDIRAGRQLARCAREPGADGAVRYVGRVR